MIPIPIKIAFTLMLAGLFSTIIGVVYDGDNFSAIGDGLYYREYLSVGNTKIEVLRWLKERYGGSIQGPYQPTNGNAKPVFNWMAAHSKVRNALPRILPYLKLKRKQAELVMSVSFIRERAFTAQRDVNGNYRCVGRTPEDMEKLNVIYLELKTMNKRGLK